MKYFIFLLLSTCNICFACDITVNSSQAIQNALLSATENVICVSPGTYSFSSTLNIEDGKILKGTGGSMQDVIIESLASRAIRMHNNTRLQNLHVRGKNNNIPDFGILSHYKHDQIIWSVLVTKTKISIGVNGSSNVRIWNSFLKENGLPANGAADPNIWISNAENVEIKYGELRGRANGPGGDGELACYNSNNVSVYRTPIIDSGASAIYFVNCDHSVIDGLVIHRPNEWGIDVVSGSDNAVIKNNTVWNARYGGAVFYEHDSIGGEFYNNDFIDNVAVSWGNFCNGINVRGEVSNITLSGNHSTPPPVACNQPNYPQ